MSRRYIHIQQYLPQIKELFIEGKTQKEIQKILGIEGKRPIHDLLKRERYKQRKLEAGIALKKRGRPPKNHVVLEEDKIAELRYKLNRKNAYIKRLEAENELMRDFLKETGRR